MPLFGTIFLLNFRKKFHLRFYSGLYFCQDWTKRRIFWVNFFKQVLFCSVKCSELSFINEEKTKSVPPAYTFIKNMHQHSCVHYYYHLHFYQVFLKIPTYTIIPAYIINIFYKKVRPIVLFGSGLLLGIVKQLPQHGMQKCTTYFSC